MELEYITRGEFSNTMGLVRDQIRDGFAETHRLQRETNGRLLRAEASVSVLEQDHEDRLAAEKDSRRWKRSVFMAVLTAGLSILVMLADVLAHVMAHFKGLL